MTHRHFGDIARRLMLLAALVCLLAAQGCGVGQTGTPSAAVSASPVVTAPVSAFATSMATPTPLPATPTPTPTPTPEPAFAYNPYVLASDTTAYLGKDIAAYRQLVDAVLAGKTAMTLADAAAMQKAVAVFYADNPFSRFISDLTVDKKKATLRITYSMSADEREQAYAAFTARVRAILREAVQSGSNDLEKALSVYRYLAQNIRYVDGDDVSPYRALMQGEGICQSYAGAYQILLLQLGIDCLYGGGFLSDDTAHEWNFLRIDGQWFHCDPTFENSGTGGVGLTFFGMTDERRMESGAEIPFSTGMEDWQNMQPPACADDRFAAFSGISRWEQVHGEHLIKLYDGAPEGSYLVFNTQTMELQHEN